MCLLSQPQRSQAFETISNASGVASACRSNPPSSSRDSTTPAFRSIVITVTSPCAGDRVAPTRAGSCRTPRSGRLPRRSVQRLVPLAAVEQFGADVLHHAQPKPIDQLGGLGGEHVEA